MDTESTVGVVIAPDIANIGEGVETPVDYVVSEPMEGSEEAEEATYVAVYNYLLATDDSAERYPKAYNKEQKRGLRRKAKRFVKLHAAIVIHVMYLMVAGWSGMYACFIAVCSSPGINIIIMQI